MRLAAGWLFVVAAVYLSLTPSPPSVGLTRSGFFLHFSGYALLMGWFATLYRPRFHLQLGMRFVAMGVCLELLQGMTGFRTFEYSDLFANGVGVLLGWSLARMYEELSGI
ncbi:MAG: VanZ family protein [Nitrospinales bacterium]